MLTRTKNRPGDHNGKDLQEFEAPYRSFYGPALSCRAYYDKKSAYR